MAFIGLYWAFKQWGTGSINALSTILNFPISFQKTVLSVVASDVGSGCHVLGITYSSLNTYSVYQLQAVSTVFRYIVLGW